MAEIFQFPDPVACRNCTYFYGEPNSRGILMVGDCRRGPPEVFFGMDGHGDLIHESVWPIVKTDSWCGEFAPIEENGGGGEY